MNTDTPDLSFEFFPPKTEQGKTKLATTRQELGKFNPEFFSVTYGAGGSTRATTADQVAAIQADGFDVAPHISFGGNSETEVLELLNSYKAAGVRHLVALRGDLPSGMGGAAQLVHANQLVEFIRQHTGDHFNINVAAYPEIHPEAESYSKDVFWLGEKFKAGADRAITQYFYSADAYLKFVDECAKGGINQPIIPGIMPLTNYANLIRFSDSCGADIPRWLRWQLKERSDNMDDLVSYGIDIVSELSQKLLDGGAPGLHFYTMNQWQVTGTLCRNLGFAENT
ncbi:5,10-methylenetetrahydrofolate reductase [marine gamma proteobacterium HTCC2207]|jgi:methylenetetrahydrofolate reductase (NADPH)|uniref:Methylenetetrahydrofolate reductase n=1 Tax=gamma proteobacterium HTCC2207 TaxID=314287 RepID=Q1YUX2_9GAMM|nr:5,10-methylenetetrahydrofolate reductase [marine gamma proteobacterium HTCC2207] [gamma proteobacterium HTCC2207]MBT6114470.1 methylenetetrahydrofolate reductase [NAD(P)H] [Porticoccaceae bacterium]MBT6593849.1 methylenetetrahydrofolate reductase [NAD(P)H] [Porticoccaceae bacterium]MDG1080443.1 methylenetetrahydrofolate reductase [NAD(P)H] [Porticoccaceae bacterium]